MSTEWLSLIVALLAVIVGPTIQLRIAKRQIRTQVEVARLDFKASVLSRYRQEWIDKVRNHVAELVSEIAALRVMYESGRADIASMDAFVRRGFKIKTTVRLLLNPSEQDHRELMDALDLALSFAGQRKTVDMALLKEHIEKIEEITKPILKREWERVKQGD
jgi:hypothetical protein